MSTWIVGGLIALPAQLAGLAAMHFAGIDYDALWHWFYNPVLDSKVAAVMIGWTVLGLPLTLAWTAVLIRLMGPVKAGVHDRWSLPFLRAWLKSGLLTLSGEWLTGTMFWRGWLRLAGMKLGRDCEISTIIDVVPELVEIGEGTFFADGIYLGGAWVKQGRATLGQVSLSPNTFLGNHAVIPPATVLPPDILIGISTVAEPDRIAAGQSRFGQHTVAGRADFALHTPVNQAGQAFMFSHIAAAGHHAGVQPAEFRERSDSAQQDVLV